MSKLYSCEEKNFGSSVIRPSLMLENKSGYKTTFTSFPMPLSTPTTALKQIFCRSVDFSRKIQSNKMDFFSSSDNVPKENSRIYQTEKGRVVDTDNTFQDDSRSLEKMDSKLVKRSASENTLLPS